MKFSKKNITAVLLIIFLSSCSDYQKLLNGSDFAKKYKAAEDYYNEGEFRKANRLFEQVIPKYRGKPQAERLIFFFAESYYQTKDYYLAAYQFENFIKSYPKSLRITEANFKAAKSYYRLSPKHSLDQSDTYTAIEKLQIFINNNPTSEYTQEAGLLIQELQTKLERKDFEIAKQYFTIQDYQAAIKACNTFIAGYPGTNFREEAMFVKFEATYIIAINSIESKKIERLKALEQQYQTFLRYYPESIFVEKLSKMMENTNKEIEITENSLTTTP